MHAIIREIADNDRAYDPWGATMGAMFGICDVLYVEGETIPVDYHPGLGVTSEAIRGDGEDSEYYVAHELITAFDSGELTVEDLTHALLVLDRYADLLKRHERDY